MYSLHFKKTITEGATENRLGELGSLYKYYYYYYYYYNLIKDKSIFPLVIIF